MISIAVAICIAFQQQPDGALTKETTLELVANIQSPLHDFSCEFEAKFVAPEKGTRDANSEAISRSYHGRFVFSEGRKMLTLLAEHHRRSGSGKPFCS